MVTSNAGTSKVRAVTRALSILRSFERHRTASLTEIANTTGLDKGTTRRLLLTLMEAGFVTQDDASQQYTLGTAIRQLAQTAPGSHDLRAIAAPYLARIAAGEKMTTMLAHFSNGSAICLDQAHDSNSIEVRLWAIGGSLPLNCGAAPKVLLAFQNEDAIAKALGSKLASQTSNTITDPKVLADRLRLIRERGWEIASDDVEIGLTSLAVPVLRKSGLIAGAISVAGLTPKFDRRSNSSRLERLKAAASEIASQLA